MKKSLAHIWVLIPARGGSKGIPRKNMRLLAGKPLILYILEELSDCIDKRQIIVSTDDDVIASISQDYAIIHHRSPETATDHATLDSVAVEVSHWLVSHGADMQDRLITVQPTSPFLKAETIIKCANRLNKSANSVLSVVDDRHLRWKLDDQNKPQPLFSERVNRQWLQPTLKETGGIIGSRIGNIITARTRIVHPVALVEIDNKEGLDIDTYNEWVVAEYYIRRKCIVVRADASTTMGMGHTYRAIALAQELAEHDIHLLTRADESYQLGADFLRGGAYQLETIISEDDFFDKLKELTPDILILDILDTDRAYVEKARKYSKSIVSLENLGTGAQVSDVVINDLYTDVYPQKDHWYGVEYAILDPKFETIKLKQNLAEDVQNILVAFGGTDPRNLTSKTLSALSIIEFKGDVVVVLGPGYLHGNVALEKSSLKGRVLKSVDNMAGLMREADIALTSAGRTVTELMTMGIPTIVLCQNSKELRHTHASSPYGVINLGLGERVETSTLAQHISMLISDYSLRQDMRARSLKAIRRRSNQRIAKKILRAVSS